MLNALLEAWRRELGQALEMMTGQTYAVSAEAASGAPGESLLWYSQRFSGAVRGLAVGAEEHVWNELGTRALQGAGIDLIERDEARNTWFELVQQSISGAARAMAREGATLTVVEGGESDGPPEGSCFFSAVITAPDGLKLDIRIAAALDAEPREKPASPAAPQDRSARERPEQRPAVERTMDVLLDVHLPVSISFGQAQLRLKDVLKLTSGSVVELNRHPEEPVDIIVNDSVIARGEVVVIEGNYAVRIQEIVSRQERLGLREAAIESARRG
jgi:flagellar motor switch protein FliN/FliY